MAWLPSIPETWSMQRNGRLFAQRNETGRPDLPVLEVSLRTGVRVRDLASGVRKQVMDDRAKYKVAHAGDLAYNMMRMWQGAVGVAPVDGLVSPAYVVARAFDPSAVPYLDLVFHTPAYMREVENWSRGIVPDRNRLYWEAFKQIQTPVPPPEEQRAIVRFIKFVDRSIRRYVAAKKKLIALLNEEKQGVIHQAVTRGLDASVPLRSSGIQWLGSVPAHWTVVRLGRVVELVTGFPFKSSGFSDSASDVRLLRGINVAAGRIRWSSVVRWPAVDAQNYRGYELSPGDIVLGMDRPLISGGVRAAVVSEADLPSLLVQRVARIRSRGILRDFAVLLLQGRSFQEYLAPIFTGISVPHLSPDQIGDFAVALPPAEEQRRIVDVVAASTFRLDALRMAQESQVEQVREYRARLVADIVTGQLDVRTAAAHVREEIEDASSIVDLFEDATDEGAEIDQEEEVLA